MANNDITFNMELDHYKNKHGVQQIYLRITQNRKHSRIKTNVFVKDIQFDKAGKNSVWIKKHPDAARYNNLLDKCIKDAKAKMMDNLIDNKYVNKELVATAIKRGDEPKDFFIFWDKKVLQMLNYNQSKGYNTTRKHFSTFINPDGFSSIDFRQITPTLLTDFENYLTKKGLDDDSTYAHLKRIKAIFNKAIREEIIEASIYPFRGYKMPKVTKNFKERLDEKEVKQFNGHKFEKGSLKSNVQKSWMFSFYCAGIRVQDLLTLQVKNIVQGRLVYQMSKNGTLKNIKVTDKIKSILKCFITSKSEPDDYIFPFLPIEAQSMDKNSKEFLGLIGAKTALLNKYLKLIAKECKIEKKIKTHTARHSFANIAKKKNMSAFDIKSALGQSSVKVTELYLENFDEESQDKMMEQVVR